MVSNIFSFSSTLCSLLLSKESWSFCFCFKIRSRSVRRPLFSRDRLFIFWTLIFNILVYYSISNSWVFLILSFSSSLIFKDLMLLFRSSVRIISSFNIFDVCSHLSNYASLSLISSFSCATCFITVSIFWYFITYGSLPFTELIWIEVMDLESRDLFLGFLVLITFFPDISW